MCFSLRTQYILNTDGNLGTSQAFVSSGRTFIKVGEQV